MKIDDGKVTKESGLKMKYLGIGKIESVDVCSNVNLQEYPNYVIQKRRFDIVSYTKCELDNLKNDN